MTKLIVTIILLILGIWGVIGYYRWKKDNQIQEDLERSKIEEERLRLRAKTLKTNIKNAGVAKALADIEEDLEDDFLDHDFFDQVENVTYPDSFEQEFKNTFEGKEDVSK